MHPTRSLVVVSLILVGIFLCVLLYGATDEFSLGGDRERSFPQQALLSDAIERSMGSVVVSTDDTRARMGAHLREVLRTSLGNRPPAPQDRTETMNADAPPSSVNEVSQNDPEPIGTTDAVCQEREVPVAMSSWGAVTMTLDEGTRTLTSSVRGDDGLPLYALTLPRMPRPRQDTSCVLQDKAAVLFDGTVVVPGVAYPALQEGLLGFALDGFPVFGGFENEELRTSADLDICHGHLHAIILDEALVTQYHYHLTEDAPYSISCFRGTPYQ